MGTAKKKGKASKKRILAALENKLKDLVVDLDGDGLNRKAKKQIRKAAKILSRSIGQDARLKLAAQKPKTRKKDLPRLQPLELTKSN